MERLGYINVVNPRAVAKRIGFVGWQSQVCCETLPSVSAAEELKSQTTRRTDGAVATAALYVAFFGTGVGLVLPGALLPLLLVRWALSDEQAGALFFVLFVGSMAGALLARWTLPLSVMRGSLAVALGAVALGSASRMLAFPAMALYGLGLGMVMTGVSVLESRRRTTDRTAHITRLNFVWAAGACVAPVFALRGAAVWGAAWVLWLLAGWFVVAGMVVAVVVKHVEAPSVSGGTWWLQLLRTPKALLIMVPLATGVESAVNGWLSTYSKREGNSLGVTVGAATCFWVGLLLSRLVQSNRGVAARSARSLLAVLPWVMVAGLVVLVAMRSGEGVLAGALLLGLGVGPMYPALLARVLERGEAGNAVFVVAGVGSSVLPLVTGVVSGWTGSLRMGLGVPLAGVMVMAVCGWMAGRGASFGSGLERA